MRLWQRLALTFLDKDGSIAIPEVVALIASVNCIVCPFVDWIRFDRPYPVATVAAALGGLVFALAAAQRVRDGLSPTDDRHADEEHR
jgi:hypothetical protein